MKVKFMPQDIELDIAPGQSILDLAQANEIHIQSVCKGIPSCAECRIYIKEGEHNVMPPQPKELELIGTAYFVDQRRLSCQLRCFGDVTIDLSEQNEKQNKSTKNPQGRYVKEREDSHARMGNVLEELTEEEMAYEAELLKSEPSQESNGSPSSNKPKAKLDNKSFYNVDIGSDQNSQKSNNRNSQNRNQNRSQQGSQNKGPSNNAQRDPQNRGPQNSQNQKNRNNQRPNATGEGAQNQNAAGVVSAEGSKSKRNRNRRRNKNRNPNAVGASSEQPSVQAEVKKTES